MKPFSYGSVRVVHAVMVRNDTTNGECMKNLKIIMGTMAASVGIVALAAPASAQDAVAGTFTGPRAEAIVGYDINRAGSSIDDDSSADNDQSFEGVVYGGAIGYDFDLGGFVVGVDAELTGSTADVEENNLDIEDTGFGRVDAGRDIYLGARVGTRVGDSGLLYLKGGYTNAKYNILANDGVTELDSDLDADGYRLGAGFEYAMTERTFAKIEYRYSNYSEAELDFGDDLETDRFDVDLDRHQIVAGFGFRF